MKKNQYTVVKEVAEDIVPMFNTAKELFLTTLKDKQMSSETIRGYDNDLKQFHTFLRDGSNAPVFVNCITTESIELLVKQLRKNKLAAASVNRKINAISSFCNFAVKKRWFAFNPAADVDRVREKSKERAYLNVEEIQKILAAITHTTIKYVVILMSNTGLRVSEATNLRLSDVDFDNKVLHVIGGKGNKDRDVPLNDALIEQLKTYKDKHRPTTNSLNFFATSKTGGISQQYVNRELKEAAKKAGIEKEVTSHVLRHSFASQLVQTQTHVAVISKLLGHADVRTTSIYMHADQTDLQQAVNTIGFLK
ncbi:tyrosine-type recombinase/integrase [Lysinibacillus fusiformis]|uniref:tyrosine-type recombinase/integrase n=1 Tax=Lysinibacillus fusiformis TaxID=28031 RepID=UPI001968A506|nr:tyrosine-type recombinase/integrase [Lysinibacillus fusiformis]QSB12311.1 tyrosine-type recombinase/integrase [Lysinibacillus fusiformis]